MYHLLPASRATRCRLIPSAVNRAFHRCRFHQLRIRGQHITATTTANNTTTDTPDEKCDRIRRRARLRHCATEVGSEFSSEGRLERVETKEESEENVEVRAVYGDESGGVAGDLAAVRFVEGELRLEGEEEAWKHEGCSVD